ncbi:MAG: hypothetical protein J6T56_04650 [Bacteroidales bacterium]|nr:hypothetical protein [Bacteroidales bacterium]
MENNNFKQNNDESKALQTLQEYGENLRRRQRLEQTIDRLAAAETPARRIPPYIYIISGVAACLLILWLVFPLKDKGTGAQKPVYQANVVPDNNRNALPTLSEESREEAVVEKRQLQREARPAREGSPMAAVTAHPAVSSETAPAPESIAMPADADLRMQEKPAEEADMLLVADQPSVPAADNAHDTIPAPARPMYIITNNVLVSYEPDDDSRKFQFFPKLRSGRQRQLPLLAHQFNN